MPDPLPRRRHKRPRPQTSCATCHRRKVRCNKRQPCEPCIRYGSADECRFDGLPAENADGTILGTARHRTLQLIDSQNTIYPSPSSGDQFDDVSTSGSDGSLVRDEDKDAFEMLQRPSSLAATNFFGKATLPTHDWLADGPVRGRTHTSWMTQLSEHLLPFLDRDVLRDRNPQDHGIFLKRKQELQRQRNRGPKPTDPLASVYDEFPHTPTICSLVVRYFETFDTVFPIIDRETFGRQLNAMLADPLSVKVTFAIQTLLMQALANTTYPDGEAPLSRDATFRWLDLASSVPTSALELGELDMDNLIVIALLNLAKQVMKFNGTADYVYSGAGVRAAMTMGLHRLSGLREVADRQGTDRVKRALWEMVLNLDLFACLVAGVPPTVTDAVNVYSPGDQEFEDGEALHEDISSVLRRSLPVRRKIVTILNSEKQLHFQQVIHLSRSLTCSMAPISDRESASDPVISFQQRFLQFVYRRFLCALHRPFMTFENPAFYLSRSMAIQMSRQHVSDMLTVCHGQAGSDPFANLLMGQGTMFRVEGQLAIMTLSYELLRDESGDAEIQSIFAESRAVVRRVIEEVLPCAERKVNALEFAGNSYVIPALALAHSSAAEAYGTNSNEYRHAMTAAGLEISRRCFASYG